MISAQKLKEEGASGAAARRTHALVVQESSAKQQRQVWAGASCYSLYLNRLPVMSNAALQLVP